MAIIVSKLVLTPFTHCPYTGGYSTALTSEPAVAPINTSLPVISGAATVGSTLTTTKGTWTGTEPFTYTYQWKRGTTNIPGATSKTYIVDADDVGFTITVTVTATNILTSSSATASPVGPVGGLINQHLPIITGAATVGTTLSTSNGVWIGTPPPTFTYQWNRDGVAIAGATANTYYLTSASTGHYITATVTATNIAGSLVATSGRVGPVTEYLVNTVPPVIAGEVTVGSVLSVTPGTYTGTTPITLTYQWNRGGVAQAGATTSSYFVTSADLGGVITCTETAANSLGNLSVTSNSIGPIIPPATLAVSNLAVAVTAAIGSTVGVISVVGGSGSYTYTLISNPSGQFGISGANLTVASILSGGTYPITIRATGGVPSTVQQNFTVQVTALTLSGNTVSEDADIGTVIGSFSVGNSTGTYTYTLTSNPGGLFGVSGSDLVVAAGLSTGSYPISVTATGGVPSPVSGSFTITAMLVVVSKVEGAWFNGLPYPGLGITANKVGGSKYWFNGLMGPQLKD